MEVLFDLDRCAFALCTLYFANLQNDRFSKHMETPLLRILIVVFLFKNNDIGLFFVYPL